MLDSNVIYFGDCLELMKDIEDESVDMILCDLPYNLTVLDWDREIPLDCLWKEYKRIIREPGAIVLTASQPFTSKLVMSNLDMFRYELIWDKGKGSNPLLARKQPMKSHENILIFSKRQTKYNPQMIDGKPYIVPRTGGNRTNKIVGMISDAPGFVQKTDSSKRFPLSIHKYSIHCGSKIHPSQKPIALFEYLIRTYTDVGEIVLDNCIGSGTTALAALNTERRFIGMEKEKKYFDIANNRIKEWFVTHENRSFK